MAYEISKLDMAYEITKLDMAYEISKLDVAYEITKLIRRVLKERQNSTENKQNFWDKWNVIFMYTIQTHQL